MPDVFLSYSRDDQATARRFAQGLEQEGFSVWWDQALSAGEEFDRITEQALEEARAVVVLWSKRSVDSRWVRAEATQAQANRRLVPVMIEPCKRPIMFELTHTADLSGWNGDTGDPRWQAFANGLRRFVGLRDAAGADSQPALPDPPVTAPASSRSRNRMLGAAAVIPTVALAAGLLWHFHARGTGAPASAGAAAAAAASPIAAAAKPSIAVLPFKDLSEKQDQGYFADGVTEEILNTLAGIKDLTVTARTSAFAFKGRDVDLREVGRTLGVAHILDGSIRKDGDQLRISAQLIDARTDAHLWSKTYDRPRQDIFKVQEDIARQVAEALQVTLGVGFGKEQGMTRDIDAYDDYLAALQLATQYTPDALRKMIALLQGAVAKDPAFANAWQLLASAYVAMAGGVTDDQQAWLRKSEEAFGKFSELMAGAPGAVELMLAGRSSQAGRWKEAGEHYRAATLAMSETRNGDGDDSGLGSFLLMVGRSREAVALLEQEKARDPLNDGTAFQLAWAYADTGNFAAASAEAERGYRLGGPAKGLMTTVGQLNAMATRDRALLRHWLDAAIALDPNGPAADFTRDLLASLLDQPAEVRARLRALARNSSLPANSRTAIAHWLLYFGDTEGALDNLRYAFEHGAPTMAALALWHPTIREARSTPAFRQLVRDAGFVDYWKEFGWGDFCKPVGDDDFECH